MRFLHDRRQSQRGNALLELAAVSIVLIPLFFGMVGVGINMGQMNQALEICRDTGHMYARGIDFSQSANQSIVVQLASGTGMTTTGGNAVAILSQIVYVYTADCTGAGLTTAQCTNLNKYVFTNRIVVGNSSLRSSNYGTPSSSIVNSSGNITASRYLTDTSAVASVSADLTAAGLTLNDGDIAWLTEFYLSTPDISYLGSPGSSGVYTKAFF